MTEWAQASNARLTADWTQSPTNSIPLSGVAELHVTDAGTRWGTAGAVDLDTRLNAPGTDEPRTADSSWAWWARLEPYLAGLEVPTARCPHRGSARGSL